MLILFSLLLMLFQQATPLVLPHDDIVTSAQWDVTETRLLTTSEDGTIRLWDARTGEAIWQVNQQSAVRGAVWDQARILAWTKGGEIVVLDAQTGSELQQLSLDGMISGARWISEDEILVWYGQQVVSLTLDGETLFSAVHQTRVLQAMPSDGHILTYELGGLAHIWDAQTGEELRQLRFNEETLGVAWRDDESGLISWGGDGAAVIWSIEDGQQLVIRSLDHTRTFVSGAAWNADQTRVVSWGADETARLWDADTGELLFSARHTDWVTGAALNKTEDKLLTWSFNTAYVWDIENRTLIFSVSHDNLVSGAVFNQDETQLLTWSWDGTARVWTVP